MRVIPAIDLKDGQCVRLLRGEADAVTVYGDDPAAQARAFQAAGARWLHVVDLDGAFGGQRVNAEAIAAIAATGLKLEVGGGLRDLESIEATLALGVERVILGTVAVKAPEVLREACARWPGRVLVGLDARDGEVAVEGWVEGSGRQASELAAEAKAAGAAGIIYTDIHRDGTGDGVNVEATAKLAAECGLPVIASGGVHTMSDLERLAEHPGIEGAITGRAVYEGTLDIEDACRRFDTSMLLD